MRTSLWLRCGTRAPSRAYGAATSNSPLTLTDDHVRSGKCRFEVPKPTIRRFRGGLNVKAFAVTALATVGCLSVPALAQENGIIDRSQVPGTAAVAPAGPITPGGPWNEFSFGGVGSFAKGCAPADPGGPGCTPSSAGNSHFVGAPPWTFVAPATERL
jgi:hypothetical protein